MSVSPVPEPDHGKQVPPPRAWYRVWSLKDCMEGSRYECECCGKPVQGGAWEQVSAEDQAKINAALAAELEPVERTEWE